MLTFFPQIYENELLYSVFARYHIRSGNKNPQVTIYELSGALTRPYPHIPRNLQNTMNNVPNANTETLSKWIESHTLYFYLTNFAKENVKKTIYSLMLDGNFKKNNVPNISMYTNDHFRYCPDCLKEDTENYGETYWRRDHQPVGVYFCLKHNKLLRDSNVQWNISKKINGTWKLEAASNENCSLNITKNTIKEEMIKPLKRITKEMLIVTNENLHLNYDSISRAYRFLLRRQGYLNGRFTNNTKLYRDFTDYYGTEFLNIIGASFDTSRRSNWLASIIKKHYQTFHPIKHILLINFLGESVSSIRKYTKKEFLPFGNPSYICLNPFSDHYLEPLITDFIPVANKENIVGLFQCECGIQFTRIASVKNEPGIYQIKSLDDCWVPLFTKLKDEMTFREIEKKDKLLSNIRSAYINYYSGKQLKYTPPEYIINSYRKQWLKLCKDNPTFSKDKLKEMDLRVYTYLYRNDRVWLESNSPKIRNFGKKEVDWKDRDEEIIEEVKKAVKKILFKNKPVRICIPQIERHIRKPGALAPKFIRRMPQTSKYLNEVIEDIESFQLRRVAFYAEIMTNEREVLTENKIRNRAGIIKGKSKRVDNEISEIVSNVKQY